MMQRTRHTLLSSFSTLGLVGTFYYDGFITKEGVRK